MSNLNQSEVEQVRTQAQQIVQRASADVAFKQQLKDDPEAALETAGFPEKYIGEFTRELTGGEGEVSGYCSYTCTITCFITSLTTA